MKKPEPKHTKAEPKRPNRTLPVTELDRVRGGHAEGSIGSNQASTWDDDWLAPV